MKKEVKLLLRKAESSLVLSVEHFNRPSDLGRTEAVLIFLDHSFEMLLKAAILHRGGRIREQHAKQTIGMEKCIAKTLSEAQVKCIDNGQAQTIRIVNSLRDASQHHLLDLSEQELYIFCQSGLSVFKNIYETAFGLNLNMCLPERVLPVSTVPPRDLVAVFENEANEIRRLLGPGSRHRLEAISKLRALAVIEGGIKGEAVEPSEGDLMRLGKGISSRSWQELFPGVASLQLTSKGYGPSLDLRFVKKGGIPVTVVPSGTPNAGTVAVKRVNELSYYSLGLNDVAAKLGLTAPKTTAAVRFSDLQADSDCYQEFQIGKSRLGRYSPRAVTKLKQILRQTPIEEIWQSHNPLAVGQKAGQ